MYSPDESRYSKMRYRRCGRSGLMLPAVSFGLWHSFGDNMPFEKQVELLRTAFDCGITHFDLANNYGPPYGEAERNFGKHMAADWHTHRDELVISTKAGYDMWDGPYGNFGSRKYLMASLDQSLKRMGLDYVDIFYHHRPDPDTPIEETMGALYDIVKSGKALYCGISNYNAEQTQSAASTLKQMGMHLLIHQPRYHLLYREPETGLLPNLAANGVGCIAFSPLFNGILTGKYLQGLPDDSRAVKDPRYLTPNKITPDVLEKVSLLNGIAQQRGESLAQMSLAWVLRRPEITSVLVGASKPGQIIENCKAIESAPFTQDELMRIDQITR